MFKINEKILMHDCEKEIETQIKYYKYDDELNEMREKDLIEEIKRNANLNTIKICGYNVNISGKIPFVQFLLMNNNNNVYDFIQLNKCDFENKSIEEIIESSIRKMYSQLKIEKESDGYHNYEYRGFVYHRKELCVLLEFCELVSLHNNISTNMFLLHEIINIKTTYGAQINEQVTQFFITNIKLFLLYDERNNVFEIPSVLFASRENMVVQNTRSLLSCKGNAFSLFGPYYYFTNFENAKLQNQYELLRVALFTGKQLVKLNYPEDDIDNSLMKQEKMNETEEIRKIEILTMRITDYDGLWTKKYDSLYIGNIELDDGSQMKGTPICVIQDISRCILLSCCNKNALKK